MDVTLEKRPEGREGGQQLSGERIFQAERIVLGRKKFPLFLEVLLAGLRTKLTQDR